MKKLLLASLSIVLVSALGAKPVLPRTANSKKVISAVKPAPTQTCTQNVCKRCRKK